MQTIVSIFAILLGTGAVLFLVADHWIARRTQAGYIRILRKLPSNVIQVKCLVADWENAADSLWLVTYETGLTKRISGTEIMRMMKEHKPDQDEVKLR